MMHSKSLKFLFALFLFSFALVGQNGFFDDFSDGDFLSNPSWQGESQKFKVNTNNQLQLDDTTFSGTAYLSTASKAILKAEWQFYIKLDFPPSASNFAKVYLTSSKSDLTQSLNGYFVQVGGQSGTVDDVSLYRQDGSSVVKLIDGIDGTVALQPRLLVRVVKDSLANWQLSIDTTSNFSSFSIQGSQIDSTYQSSNYSGVYCKFTSTRSDEFFFDDFNVSGSIVIDTTKPRLTELAVLDSLTITLAFSELLSDSTLNVDSAFLINKGIGLAQTISYLNLDSSSLILSFLKPFQNGELLELTISGIRDRNGNELINYRQDFTYFAPTVANYREIQINEFYPDFSPSNGLPESEFIELFNASNKIFDLENWVISDRTTNSRLPSIKINPGDYLIICPSADTSDFLSFGSVLGISPFPTLNNDGDDIKIFDNTNRLIDDLTYTKEWYQDNSKSDGGWTIEQINPDSKCNGFNNFKASIDSKGGSPGQANSVINLTPDQLPPELINAVVLASDTVQLIFNESIDTLSIPTASYTFSVANGIKNASTGGNTNEVILTLLNQLDSGVIVDIEVENLFDCSGNSIATNNKTQFILAEQGQALDLIINEVLFNPRSGGSDFVEIYNNSEKIISLKNWAMANSDGVPNKKIIIDSEYLVFPQQYIGLTENIQSIIDDYPNTAANRFIEVSDLPSYNDDEGTVILVSNKNSIIDQFDYNDDMHFELLNDDEGVSLERINPNGSSESASNFHSASESAGFATPGIKNSQYFLSQSFNGNVTIEPKTFSPDNDGFQDVLSINYSFGSPGYVANVSIYDRSGRLIKRLVQNELLGGQGNFIWDGINDDNQKARIGIYIILFEAFNTQGDKEVFKIPAVLAGYLD